MRAMLIYNQYRREVGTTSFGSGDTATRSSIG